MVYMDYYASDIRIPSLLDLLSLMSVFCVVFVFIHANNHDNIKSYICPISSEWFGFFVHLCYLAYIIILKAVQLHLSSISDKNWLVV